MTPLTPRRRSIIVLVAVVATLAMVVTPVTSHGDTDPAFIVEVHADGSAVVSVRSTLDLTAESEQEAFQSLIDDEQAQQDATARFRDRMRAVARDAENATGRETAVTDARIHLHETADGETGVVTLSVTWEGLAAVDGDHLTVTEPFASGFTPDRPFVLRAPDGYEFRSTTPEPDVTGPAEVVWSAGSDLSGFSIELQPGATTTEPAAADGETTRSGGQPGFGPTAAVMAGIVGTLAAKVRHRFR